MEYSKISAPVLSGDQHCGIVANIGEPRTGVEHLSYARAQIDSQTAALAPRKEVPPLFPGSQIRPADVFLPCWKGGRPAALDITVISTMQQLTIQSAAEIQGHALLVAEELKFAAHGAECQADGISFIPLAIETLGDLSDTTADTISNIGRLIGQRFGISPTASSRQLFQRLATPSGVETLPHGSSDACHPLHSWTALSEPSCLLSFVFFVMYFLYS